MNIDPLFQPLERDGLHPDFRIARHWPRVRTLMARYDQMDLAEASIVVMSALYSRSQVITIERNDFSVYRRNDRQVSDLIAPPKQ